VRAVCSNGVGGQQHGRVELLGDLRLAGGGGQRDPTTFGFRIGRPVELAARGIYVRAPRTGGGYQLWTGTSFACPHVTALVARLLSLNPALTPFQIKTLLHVLRANCDGEPRTEPW
jgi:subtilisin family serine protease